MGLFDNKDLVQAVRESAKLEAMVETQRNEIEFLRKQVLKLQEALYAKESPVAYNQMKLDEVMADEIPQDPEEKQRLKSERDFYSKYAVEQERPLFETREELESVLASMTRGAETTPRSFDPSNPEA